MSVKKLEAAYKLNAQLTYERDRARMLRESTESQFLHALSRVLKLEAQVAELKGLAMVDYRQAAEERGRWSSRTPNLLTEDEQIVARYKAGDCILCEAPGRGGNTVAHGTCWAKARNGDRLRYWRIISEVKP